MEQIENSMYFGQIDKNEFEVNCNKIKLTKQIVQYIIYNKYDILVLLVSNENDWKNRDEVVAIRAEWNTYKILWSYQRRDSNNTEPCPIHKIWKVELDGKERVACLVNTVGSHFETYVFDVETGEII